MANKSTPNIATIGSKEYIDFPEFALKAVPAKVDTGADSSAIWASDINESNGQLSYVLFDKKSIFFTGKRHHTREYSVSNIKNSFGHAEKRYKVRLKIRLAERTFYSKFTLANREHNRFPILLGRRTIHGKFLVDVALNQTKDKAHVLMLSHKIVPSIRAFASSLDQKSEKATIELTQFDDLLFLLESNDTKVLRASTDTDIATNEMVYFKSSLMDLPVASAAANYLQFKGVKFVDRVLTDVPATTKLQQYMILGNNGVSVPKSVFVYPNRLEEFYDSFKELLGLPFILKDIKGDKGRDNHLVDDRKTFIAVARSAKRLGIMLIAQKYIDNDRDYRVLVFGKKVTMIIERRRLAGDSHLNNTSTGARAKLLEKDQLPAKVLADSIFAANLMERQVAGVDMIQDKKSGMWYCLEVNESPQLASGAFTAEKQSTFAKYLDLEIK